VSLPVVILSNSKLIGFSAYDIALLIALILGAQLLGHTMFNASLKRVSPVVVSLIVFFEVPVSAFFAYIWLGQQPPAGTIPGIIGLLFGCALFVVKSSQETSQLK
jgi:drug/metabolite transporter (DMT)-like permease